MLFPVYFQDIHFYKKISSTVFFFLLLVYNKQPSKNWTWLDAFLINFLLLALFAIYDIVKTSVISFLLSFYTSSFIFLCGALCIYYPSFRLTMWNALINVFKGIKKLIIYYGFRNSCAQNTNHVFARIKQSLRKTKAKDILTRKSTSDCYGYRFGNMYTGNVSTFNRATKPKTMDKNSNDVPLFKKLDGLVTVVQKISVIVGFPVSRNSRRDSESWVALRVFEIIL